MKQIPEVNSEIDFYSFYYFCRPSNFWRWSKYERQVYRFWAVMLMSYYYAFLFFFLRANQIFCCWHNIDVLSNPKNLQRFFSSLVRLQIKEMDPRGPKLPFSQILSDKLFTLLNNVFMPKPSCRRFRNFWKWPKTIPMLRNYRTLH